MDSVTYIRRQPWRPRKPWFGNRAGARRRGVRQDDLCLIPEERPAEVDLVVSVMSEVAPIDDALLAETVSEPAEGWMVPARVDVSGLLAIAALELEQPSRARVVDAFADAPWHTYGEQGEADARFSRRSA
jgi:hypothetical protein